MIAEKRFYSHVKKKRTGCWEWQGEINRNGYGRFWAGGKRHMAHKWLYEWEIGVVPTGLILLHSCDNRCCVNPAHLTPGTHQANVLDMLSKGRHKSPFYKEASNA